MRAAILIVLLTGYSTLAADESRFGVKPDTKAYPQGTAKETLTSILKSVDDKRVDYLLAQLAEPDWVDSRVEKYGGQFKELVTETTNRLNETTVKQLKGFLDEGEWDTVGDEAVVKHKKWKDRQVRFKKQGERWYLQNDYRPR